MYVLHHLFLYQGLGEKYKDNKTIVIISSSISLYIFNFTHFGKEGM